MGELVAQFGGKQPGELILAANWNDLVAAIESVQATLSAQITALGDEIRGDLAQVQTDLAGLQTTVGGLQATVNVVRQQHRVVTSTPRVRYALGEVAVLTAQVTDFEGNPLALDNAAARPWVDFVTTWGQLKPGTGFVGFTGEQGRSVSVQVDAQGVAQVTLRAEQSAELSADDERDVATSLTAVVPSQNATFAELILQANTPVEAHARGAFALMSTEYDLAGDTAFTHFADSYYQFAPQVVVKPVTGRWREHHTTVLAMSRNDDDPTTPDPARGASSIQVTFRDWVGPWIDLDYFGKADGLVKDYSSRFKTRVNPNKYGESLVGLYDEVQEIARGKGVVGRLRDYRAAYAALDQVEVTNPPPFLVSLIKDTQSFVGMQQTLVYSQANTPGLALPEGALAGIANAAAQSDLNLGGVQEEVATLAGQLAGAKAAAEGVVAQAEERVGAIVADARAEIAQQVQGLDGRVGKLDEQLAGVGHDLVGLNQRVSSELPAIQDKFGDLQQQVAVVQQNVSDSITKQLGNLQQQVGVLQGRVGTVEGKFNTFDQAVLADGGQFQRMQRTLDTLQGQVSSFQIEGVQPSRIASGLIKVDNVTDQVAVLNERLAKLEGGD